ncbi:mucin-5B-like isoform X2 [Hyperolius riggenbachi]|uniref:mucin-5B-like isoform X2 n=1 Tax=Hyperolius riggenbachi TaxID=752182 RepID=UPI0035A3553F
MKGGKSYKQGETINDVCNTCTCKNSSWVCTEKHCSKTCTVYGNGHTITFDEAKGTIDSNHNHILFQDYCQNNTGSIQVILENNLCSGSNTICSLKLRIILLKTIIEISENTVACMDRHDHQQKDNSYRIETIGQNIIFKTSNLTVTYDRKLTVNVDLQPPTEGYVCGLCGDNDGYANNDLISSWSQHQTYASGVRSATEPCHDKPEKLAWAEKHCDIIKSDVFATCHSVVEPQDFYDTCIADTCSCGDDIGDCECLCASVAAYSAECGKHDICIKWRTPEICPIFCDYYNKDGHCDWHYKPCGSPCLPTCYNPNGNCDSEAREYEGCFPECSKERPIFDAENEMCIPLLNCTTCNEAEKLCDNKTGECLCCYNGQTYRKGDSITAYVNGKICPVGYCMDDGMLALMSTDCLFTPATTPVTITEFLTEILPTGISLESKTTETSSRSTFYTALLKSLSTPSSYSALHSTAKPTNGTNVISASVSSSTKEGFSITRKVTESELTSHISSTTPKLTSSIIPFTLSPTTVPRTIHKEFSSSLPSLITTTYTPTLTPATTLTYPDTFSVSRTVMISSPSPSETTETTSKATIESRTTNIYVTGSFLKMVTTPTTFTPTTHFYSDTIPVSKTIPLSSSTSIKTMHISTLTTLRSSTQLTTTPTLNNTMFSIYTGLSKITKATKPSSTAAEMQTGYSQSVSLTKSKTTYPSTNQSSSESPPTFNECKLEAQNVNITKGECSASKTLTVNYCLGHCTTYSEFSFKTQRMVRTCSCCKETKITPRTIQLDCQNGKTEPYTYDHIEECVCEPVTCQG